MKKIMVLLLSIATVFSVQAQKIYQTKAGKVNFFSATAIENIEAQNYQVDSKLASNGQIVFLIAIRGFVFKNALMQEHFNENYLESDKFPKATFLGNVSNINEVDFSKDGTYKVNVSGEMEMHGVKQKLTIPGTIVVLNGKVECKSSFKLTITDFGIKGKYIGERIAKEVEITLDCKYD